MKKYLFLFIFTFSFLISCTSNETSTYYLIRHAEKDRTDQTNKNPYLNIEGKKRALNWSKYFQNINLDGVYSTNYNRTIETATPTAMSQELELKKYDSRKMYDSIFQLETKGKTILIVGHSNTTPIFANTILGENKYANMDDHDNSSIYIVTISKDKKTSKVKKIE